MIQAVYDFRQKFFDKLLDEFKIRQLNCSNIRHMRWVAALCFALASLAVVEEQKHPASVPSPEQFEIGRRTFFDFGPPFDFYELLIVRPKVEGASVERILLTPPTDACFALAKVETSSASLGESVSGLLGKTNPCSIPEKELHRELKRCKNCLVFSGANVTMRVQCGANSRLIRSDILDRDMFDSAPNTPEHTAWTMQLLQRLDQALGPGVMEKPMFAQPSDNQSANTESNSTFLKELDAGAYDELFPNARQKLSELYRETQAHHPPPTTRLLSSTPFAPLEFVHPDYPPLARMAHVEGPVSFNVEVDADGRPATFVLEKGNPLFLGALRKAVSEWRFPKDAAGQQVQATIEFALNCPSTSR